MNFSVWSIKLKTVKKTKENFKTEKKLKEVYTEHKEGKYWLVNL